MRLIYNAMLRQACRNINLAASRVQPCRYSAAATSNDRSYPAEPRVGVGVVILRPSPETPKTVEVRCGKM